MTMQMHKCPRCGAKFDTFESLDQHLFETHTNGLEAHKFRCVTCDAEFKAEAEWLKHEREAH
jgi:uncharacterized C2H2 Zn-finger protein